MVEKASSVVLNFKMDGQVQYAQTLKQINSVMNTAAKEYKNHVAAMGNDASATDKLAAEKKKLEIQMEGAQKRTKMLRAEYEEMAKDTNTTTDQLTKMYGKVLDSERAETSLEKSLERVNEGLSEQAVESRNNKDEIEQLTTEQSLLEAQSKKLTSEYKLQSAELGENASEAEKNALAQEHLGKQTEIAEKQISNMEKQLEITKSEFGESSEEAIKMETKLNEAKAAFNNLGDEMKDAGNAADNTNGQLEGIQNTLNAEAFMNASEKLGEIRDKLIEIGQSALEAFGIVDEGLDIIVTKTGASGKDMAVMETAFKNIASSLPIEDLSLVGEAVGEVNTQFGSMGEELEKQSALLLKFSEINGHDVTDSTIQAKQAIEAYSLSNEDLEYVLDSVTSTAQATGQATQDLFKKAVEGAPQIKALGLEFDQGVELMGKFEKSGVDSSAALASLSKASVVYAKDGKSLEEGLNGTVKAILSAKDETEALTIASEVFGTKGSVRMLDAIQRGAISFEGLGANIENIAGITETTFENTLDPIDQMTITANDAKLGMADLGGAIAETLEPILRALSLAIQSVAGWFSNLSPGMREVIVIIGLVTTGVAAVLPILAGLAAAAAFAGTSIAGLILSALPIVGIIVGVIAAITAVIVVIQNFGTIVDWMKEKLSSLGVDTGSIFSSMQSIISNVIQSVSGFVMSVWGTLVSWWNQNNGLILQTAQVIWSTILSTIQNALNVLVPIVRLAWSVISGATSVAWSLIKGVVTTGINAVLGIVKMVMQILTGDWRGAWTSLWKILGGILKNIINTVTSTFNSILSSATNIFGNILSIGKSIWGKIGNAIMNPIEKAKETVKKAINAIKGFMDFDWSLPKIKLPHFSVSGSANPMTWLSDGVPKIKVDWRAKGAIFTQPTIFGATGGRLQGAGDAGPEAALPLNDETLGAIGRGIASTMNVNQQQSGDVYLQINGQTFAKIAGPFFSNYNGQEIRVIDRGLARD